MQTPGILLSFIAGLLSFFSPCVLAVAPGYLAILTGSVPNEEQKEASKTMIFAATVFILGFTLVFVLLGTVFSVLGQLVRELFLKIGGLLLVFLGLVQLGLFNFFPLQREFRLHLKRPKTGVVGWFFTGATFAFGWTPCVGPILGMILTMAGSSGQVRVGVLLLLVYSLGLAVPFILLAIAFQKFYKWYKKLLPHTRIITLVSGLLLVIVGLLIFTDRFNLVSSFLNRVMGSWSLEELLFHRSR